MLQSCEVYVKQVQYCNLQTLIHLSLSLHARPSETHHFTAINLLLLTLTAHTSSYCSAPLVMPNKRNHVPSSPSTNLRSKQGAGVAQPRETPSQRAARKASEAKEAERRAERAAKAAKQREEARRIEEEAKEAERRAARAAAKANKQREGVERIVEEVGAEGTARKRVVGAETKKRKKKLTNTKGSKKKKTSEVDYNSSDSVEIESPDEDSGFEPSILGSNDEDDDDDDKSEMDSYATPISHDSGFDNNQSASPEDGRHGAREAAEELRRGAQEGTANPRRTSHSEEQGTPPPPRVRANTREIVGSMPLEPPTAQKNVARRITLFVKNTLFRQIKFVTSTKSFNEAFQKVLVEERPRHPYMFQLTYQSAFKHALNQKRSSCELSGSKIVIRAINTVFKDSGEQFFTFDELCKLRRATTDREKKAFIWFFDSFLECVCGTSAWNNAKTKQLVSEARDQSGSKVVSVSDEAFGLLLIDNYMEKWRKRATEDEAARIKPVGDSATAGEDPGGKRTKTAGKYTGKAKGQCKWGGWNSDGIKQFNFLRKLVKADREADKSNVAEPKQMEKFLLDYCRTKAGKKDPRDDENLDGAGDTAHNHAAARAKAMVTVEAEWDSDEDE